MTRLTTPSALRRAITQAEPSMTLTSLRARFLDALEQHGPFSYAPTGVQFPSEVVLGQMERAGWIATRAVGPATHHVARGEITRRVEFRITERGRAMKATEVRP